MKFKDPQTPAEWQDAVNAAYFWMLLDDARLYGFVAGGPEVDRVRCLEVLDRGQAQGWVPRDPSGRALGRPRNFAHLKKSEDDW